MRGNPFLGGGGQLVAWGEKGDIARGFFAKVTVLEIAEKTVRLLNKMPN